jgi:phosphate transport system permease protein
MTTAVAAANASRTRDDSAVGAWFNRALDRGTVGIAVAGAAAMIVLLLFLAGILFFGALPAIRSYGWRFLIDSDWDPVEMHFGALPTIYGTLVSSFLALLIAVPVSIGSSVFLVRLAPRWLVGPASFLIELLAAIPSIAYGFWGIAVLVPFLQRQAMPLLKGSLGKIPVIGQLFSGPPTGLSMMAAGLVLSIMVIPIITAVARDVIRSVPRELEEGAYALGATWWQATLAVLNYGRLGIFGAIVLGFARAIGETMAVTMVIGNSNDIKFSFFAPAQTMASILANEFMEADKPAYAHALIYIAFVLLLLTVAMNFLARFMVLRVTKPSVSHKPAAGAVPAGATPDAAASGESSRKNEVRAARKIELRHSNPFVTGTSRVMSVLCVGAAVLTLALLAAITGYIVYQGFAGLSLDLFTRLPGPLGMPSGMRNCIVGTLILIALGSLFGIPLGLFCGVYLAEYAKDSPFGRVVRLVVDVLAGTPSIIVGVLVYQLVVVPMGSPSCLAGAIALGFMMCPIIAKTTEEMLKLVPSTYREASHALAGTRFHTLFLVVLPAASSGIVTGIMLGVARIAGETAPLLFTALGSDLDIDLFRPFSWLTRPFPSLTLKIFQYATSAPEEWRRQAWAAMLILVFIILVLSAAVRYASRNQMQARS